MTNKTNTFQKKQETKDLRKSIRKEAKKFCNQKLFQKSIYLGKLNKQHIEDGFSSFLFKITIENENFWIIVRKYDTTPQYCLYCISDSDTLMQYLVKTL